MNQQQPTQQQVPDHRFAELSERLRKLEAENNQLRGTIDAIYVQRTQTQQPTEEKPLFQPEVDAALEKKIKGLISPETDRLKQQFGYLVDENDALKFQQKWGTDTFEKYKDKIEAIRQQAAQRGQFIPREDAYKHVYFEENSRKPQAKPEAPKGPQFDPYLNRFVGEPQTQPTPQAAPQAQVTPQATPQAAPTVDPTAELPPVGTFVSPTKGAPQATAPIDLGSDDQGLAAWEAKYGDIPL